MRVVLVVTHLLGSGHLRRSINLALAFRHKGHEVTLVSGGMPMPQFPTEGITLVQLPAIRSDGTNFGRLLSQDGKDVTSQYMTERQRILIDVLGQVRPDVLVTELFPFGRRNLRAEFNNLLENAQLLARPPLVFGSVRDILSPPSTRKKALETEQLVHKYYAGILVHSSQSTTPLSLSWPVSAMLEESLLYTGYVSQPLPESTVVTPESREIVVSAGGGSVGMQLYEVAVDTARECTELNFRILVGGSDSYGTLARLQNRAKSMKNVVVEPVRTDFLQLLKQAECSVSMCGYNTAVDLMQTGTPTVFVPFDEGDESEQRLRATSLSQRYRGFATLLASELSPVTLSQQIAKVRTSGRFTATDRFDGADKSVEIVMELAQKRRTR